METLTRILLVEDEASLREVAKLALERVGGFVVEACDCGAAALLKAESFQPDLVLLDVMMPGMDGPTTMAGLRELTHTRNVPVVFLTAKVRSNEVSELEQTGAIGVLPKPFDPMRLSEQVHALWRSQLPHSTP